MIVDGRAVDAHGTREGGNGKGVDPLLRDQPHCGFDHLLVGIFEALIAALWRDGDVCAHAPFYNTAVEIATLVFYFTPMSLHQFQQSESDEALALGTEPIPAGPYYQYEYFELEREAIFRRTWLNIGHVSELPEAGSFILRPLEFANASLLITRDQHGVIRA